MKKNIFFKKNNLFIKFILYSFILIFISYLFFFYLNFNKPYFILHNNIKSFYIIPKDKKGEKVKFVDKKSINYQPNNLSVDNKFSNIKNLNFSIQLFSDVNYDNAKEYLDIFMKNKSSIIDSNDLYFFSIQSDIGKDYFVTYKNFSSKADAINFCNNSNILNNCLIINLQNE